MDIHLTYLFSIKVILSLYFNEIYFLLFQIDLTVLKRSNLILSLIMKNSNLNKFLIYQEVSSILKLKSKYFIEFKTQIGVRKSYLNWLYFISKLNLYSSKAINQIYIKIKSF